MRNRSKARVCERLSVRGDTENERVETTEGSCQQEALKEERGSKAQFMSKQQS